MPDFAFYREVYGGLCEKGQFEACLAQAAALVERMEARYTVSYPTPESRDKAVCAVLDEVYLTRAALGTDGSLTPWERVKQLRVGAASAVYDTQEASRALQDKGARYYDAVRRYADVYRGVCRGAWD